MISERSFPLVYIYWWKVKKSLFKKIGKNVMVQGLNINMFLPELLNTPD